MTADCLPLVGGQSTVGKGSAFPIFLASVQTEYSHPRT